MRGLTSFFYVEKITVAADGREGEQHSDGITGKINGVIRATMSPRRSTILTVVIYAKGHHQDLD